MTLGLGMLLLLFRLLPPTALALRRLPAVDFAKTRRFLAVALIPDPRLENAITAQPVTSPGRKAVGTGRTRRRRGRLFASHGRWCSRWGRPRGCCKSLGHLSDIPLIGSDGPAARDRRTGSSVYSAHLNRSAACYQRCASVIQPSAPETMSCHAPIGRRKSEGNREGDGLALAPSGKETHRRRKPAKELHPGK